MKRLLGRIIKKGSDKKTFIKNSDNVSDTVEAQLKKYTETYKLLGEYDKKSIEDPTVLAKPGRLQKYTSRIQRYSNS